MTYTQCRVLFMQNIKGNFLWKTSTNCMIYEWQCERLEDGHIKNLLSFNFIQFWPYLHILQWLSLPLRQTNTLHINISLFILFMLLLYFVSCPSLSLSCVYVLNSHLIEITCAWNWSIVYTHSDINFEKWEGSQIFEAFFLCKKNLFSIFIWMFTDFYHRTYKKWFKIATTTMWVPYSYLYKLDLQLFRFLQIIFKKI